MPLKQAGHSTSGVLLQGLQKTFRLCNAELLVQPFPEVLSLHGAEHVAHIIFQEERTACSETLIAGHIVRAERCGTLAYACPFLSSLTVRQRQDRLACIMIHLLIDKLR